MVFFMDNFSSSSLFAWLQSEQMSKMCHAKRLTFKLRPMVTQLYKAGYREWRDVIIM